MSLKKQADETAKELKAKLDRESAIHDGIDARIVEAEKTQGDEVARKTAVASASKPTDDEEKELKSLHGEIKELDERLSGYNEYVDARDKHESMRKALTTPGAPPDYGTGPVVDPKIKSIAQEFLNAPEYKDWVKFVAPQGKVGSGRLESPSIPVALSIKALITGVSLGRESGSGMVRPDYAGVVPFLLRPLTLRDVITVSGTGSDLVEFTRISSFTNNAAPTAEATTGALDSTSGLKPESALTTEIVKEPVRSIPHWIPITRRAMMDAPQMEGYVNDLLMQGCEITLEDQMITGDGAGENLLGLDNTPGITLQAPVLTSSAIDLLKTTRQARTKVRTIGRARPTAYLMHPNDWEQFDVLSAPNSGNFYFGGPLNMGQARLWGVPVIESEAVLEGTFYVGDMKQAILWDREQASVRISDSPDNYFLRNLLAILCELRAAFGVLRPSAIVRGDLVVGNNS